MFADVHHNSIDRVSPSHRQWCDEITLVYSGNGKTIHNGKEFPLIQNSIHLCFKDDVHQIISSKQNPLHFSVSAILSKQTARYMRCLKISVRTCGHRITHLSKRF